MVVANIINLRHGCSAVHDDRRGFFVLLATVASQTYQKTLSVEGKRAPAKVVRSNVPHYNIPSTGCLAVVSVCQGKINKKSCCDRVKVLCLF